MNIALLGSTGSIGTSTLEIIRRHPDRFQVVSLAAHRRIELLADQIREFSPRLVGVADEAAAERLQHMMKGHTGRLTIAGGTDGVLGAATAGEADMVVAAIAGSAGLSSTLAAVKTGKTIALANKESLVMAGELIIQKARSHGSAVIPVDSEHSAVFQLLEGRPPDDIQSILLTASGGPFFGYCLEDLKHVTPEDALKHPRWTMGYKVTTDSATLMNKGLEVIEAHWLFGLPPDRIRVIIHPESIIHSMVEFVDGSVFAQMSHPDMKGPIAYALSYPRRLDDTVAPLHLTQLAKLTFHEPDTKVFPCLRIAYEALREGGLMPAVMNAANEVAVEKFHDRQIPLTGIAPLIEGVMDRFTENGPITLETVMHADGWARSEAERRCRG